MFQEGGKMRDSIFMEFPHERTVFSDENYAVLGRALAYATAFESVCRELSILNFVKAHVQDIQAREELSFEEALIQAAGEIWDSRLRQHMSLVIQYFEPSVDVKTILTDAKAARNEIAHELSLGMSHWVETDKGRHNLLKRVCELSMSVARGVVVLEFLSLFVSNEPLPSAAFISEYPKRIQEWIFDIKELS